MELIAQIIRQTLETINNPEQVTEITITQSPSAGTWYVDVNNDTNFFVSVSWLRNYGFTSSVHEYGKEW